MPPLLSHTADIHARAQARDAFVAARAAMIQALRRLIAAGVPEVEVLAEIDVTDTLIRATISDVMP
jgi:hypothetical protein